MNNQDENNGPVNDAIRSYGLKQNISRIHTEMMQSMHGHRTTPVRPLYPMLMKMAAAVLFLVFATGIFIYTTSTPQSLFESRFHPYENTAQRGSNDQPGFIHQKFDDGQSYLRNGDVQRAIITFAGILGENARSANKVLNDDAEYYLALAYLKDEQPENALPILEKIHNDTNHLYHDEVSSWFLFKAKLAAWKNK